MKKHMRRFVSMALITSLALSLCSISVLAKDTNITVGGGDTNITVGGSASGSGGDLNIKKPELEPFIDVTERDWFYNDVVKVHQAKLMEGTSDTEFSPYARLTRGMVATILYRHEGSPSVSYEKLYDDLEKDEWYTDGVIWATENEVIFGYGNGLCGPEDFVTIEQLAAILYRFAGSPEVTDEKIKEYADYESITPYAVDAMEWACENEMIIGSLLHPTSITLRAEAAKMFAKILEISK